jgi:hypothetical protein
LHRNRNELLKVSTTDVLLIIADVLLLLILVAPWARRP